MEKLKPTYKLADVRAAFADPTMLNRTFVSKQGANALGMDDAAVVQAIQTLTNADFEKSMTAYDDNRQWQDVYKPVWSSRVLYIKFTTDAQGALLLLSFKEA